MEQQIGNNLLVAQTLASSIKSLLGPQHSLKCCISDDETVTCSSTSKLLQFMDIQHPAGFIINDTCLGHYKKYRTNCKTLVCLAGFWSRSARYLLDQGIPVPVIVHLFDEALEECENVCQEICLPLLETLHATLNTSQPAEGNCLITSENTTVGNQTAYISGDVENCTVQRPSGENSTKLSEQDWFFGCHVTVGSSQQSAAFRSSDVTEENSATETNRSSFRNSEDCQERIKTTGDFSSKTENYNQGTCLETNVNVLSGVNQLDINIEKREISDSMLLIDQKIDEFKLEPVVETSPCDTKQPGNVANNLILHSEVDQKRGEDDEFDACFSDALCRSSGEILGEPSVAKKRGENLNRFQTAARERQYIDHCSTRKKYSEKKENVTDAFPRLKSSGVMNSGLVPNSAEKEEQITSKMLSFLAERRGMKNKGISKPVKYSEVYKGSRHMVKDLSRVDVSSSDVCFNTKVGHISYDNLEKSSCSKRTQQNQLSESSMTNKCNLMQSGFKSNRAGESSLCPIKEEKSQNRTSRHGQVNERVLHQNRELLSALGSRLSHGKVQEMELAVGVISNLIEASGQTALHDFEIHVRVIHSQLVLGPPSSNSQIVNGLLMECSAAFHFVVGRIEPGTSLSVALVNGDVTPEYRHPGLNQECGIHRIHDLDDFKSRLFNQEQDWYQSVIHILRFHGIGVLIVKGTAHQSVLDYCLSHGIVALQGVAYSCLQVVSYATDTIIVSYLSDLRESDIGRPVTIETWEIGWTPSKMRRQTRKDGGDDGKGIDLTRYVVVRETQSKSAGYKDLKSSMQTVLLCSPCGDLLSDMEERFWNAVYRLKNSLRHNRVLPGAGAIEIACVQRLVKLADEQETTEMSVRRPSSWLQQNTALFRPSVLKEFMQGFKEYLISVVRNSGELNAQQALLFVEGLINKSTSQESIPSVKPSKAENFASEIKLNFNRFPGKLDNPEDELRDSEESPTTNQEDFQDQTYSLISSFNRASSPGTIQSTVWDDYSAKIEAWKRAVSVVKILLQCDCLIQTGIKEH